MKKNAQIEVNNEKIAALLVGTEAERPKALFLHGAGQATKERALPLAEELAASGFDSVLFDFSGHGESTGELLTSSLSKRVSEAKAVAAHFQFVPETLVAFSMGGHIALELLKEWPIRSLILFYPAIYADEATAVSFGEGFSDIIRVPESWRRASIVDNLEDFEGTLLIVVGGNDAVIPRGVIQLLESKAIHASKKEVCVVPNVGHALLEKVYADPRLREKIFRLLNLFIQ